MSGEAVKLEPKMIAWLDEKLSKNTFFQHCIAIGDARTALVEAAKVCVGIREATNHNDGAMVELMQETIGRAVNESWCMSFCQTLVAYICHKLGIKTPLYASEHCMTVWNNTPVVQRVKYLPLPGAIVIWRHGVSSNGHTGILLASDGVTFHAIEGNTTSGSEKDPSGPVVREGGGVYFTKRSSSGNGDMHVVGYLKPF